ncbi:MAG TPA: NRDE family protein [Balneolaceae bacterium]|nr:NRDE family protein [Balneolaceae bacterium]
MCLIVFSYKQHPDYDLVFAANRDENHNRPTRPAQFWDDHPDLLAGKDLKAGGTWMGITKEGAFSALTNYRDPSIQKENPPSRGHLVLDYLIESRSPASYLQQVDKKADRYMGFNLLTGSPNQLGYYSNQERTIKILEPGLYGLSNHLLDTPWPKVNNAKTQLDTIIKDKNTSEEALFSLLADEQKANDNQLPNTGIPKEIEKKVSSIFIKSDGYGTRCSTILLIGKGGQVTFAERRFKPGTKEAEDENRFEFMLTETAK